MDINNTHAYAKWLLDTYGGKAEVHAAQEEQKCKDAGDNEAAESWHKIRLSIREMRGAHES